MRNTFSETLSLGYIINFSVGYIINFGEELFNYPGLNLHLAM